MPPMPSSMLVKGCTGFRVRMSMRPIVLSSPFANQSVLPSVAIGPTASTRTWPSTLPSGETKPIERGSICRARRSGADDEEADDRSGGDDDRSRPASRTLRRRAVRRAEPAEARRIPPANARVGRLDRDRRDRLGEPFHALEPPLAVANAVHGARELEHGLAREHFAGAGERAKPSGEVERTAAVPVRDRNRLAGVESDADAARKIRRGNFCLELHRRTQRLPRGVEDDERLVAAKLDQRVRHVPRPTRRTMSANVEASSAAASSPCSAVYFV